MIRITGRLSLRDLFRTFGDPAEKVSIPPATMARVRRSRAVVERVLQEDRAVYGVNTGFGKLSRVRIDKSHIRELQRNLIRSHAVGVGPPFPPVEARLMVLLRLNALCVGFSGVTPRLIDALARLYNSGIVPYVPEQGSVGASGDLAPLSHLALLLMGEGEALVGKGDVQKVPLHGISRSELKRIPGRLALKRAGLKPIELAAKEGLSLVNGTQVMTATLAWVVYRAQKLCLLADLAGARSLEALMGTLTAFDPRIQAVRPHPGQATVARNFHRLLKGSGILVHHADCDRVQDSYSVRCIPQVHGAVRDVLGHVVAVLEREVNSATDNPLVFPDTGEILSGGNFHGQPIAMAADHLAIALSELASISERRIETLVNPDLSGLPPFLSEGSGLHSGMMITQVAAASLVSENKVLAHPASVDSIPTSANKEDHVSMGTWAARKCRWVMENLEAVLAIEFLCAAQGLDFLAEARDGHPPLLPGAGVRAAWREIRKRVKHLGPDRTLYPDIAALRALVRDDTLLAAAAAASGALM